MQHRRERCVLSAGFALVVVAALVACTAQPPATTAPPSTPSPTPVPSEPPGAFGTWVPLPIAEPLPHVFGGSGVYSATQFADGYVAVGGVNGGCCTGGFTHDTHGVVWRSSDGLAWELEPNDPVFDLARVTGLTTDGHRIVATGVRLLPSTVFPGDAEPHGATWSSDDGVTWDVIKDAPIFTAVAATDHGFVGAAEGDAGPVLWRSADGRSWDRITSADLGSGVIHDIVVTPSAIVAVGWVEAIGGGSRSAMSWRSADGSTWHRSGGQAWLAGAAMTAVEVFDSRFVAIGEGDAVAALWWSDDGLTWTRVMDGPMAKPATSLQSVFASAAGFLLAGSLASTEASIPMFWASGDGRAWSQIDVPDGVVGADFTAAVARGDALTIFQSSWDAAAGRPIPAAWDVR
jgi:hypothetical protein